jgi:hypothetical protein
VAGGIVRGLGGIAGLVWLVVTGGWQHGKTTPDPGDPDLGEPDPESSAAPPQPTEPKTPPHSEQTGPNYSPLNPNQSPAHDPGFDPNWKPQDSGGSSQPPASPQPSAPQAPPPADPAPQPPPATSPAPSPPPGHDETSAGGVPPAAAPTGEHHTGAGDEGLGDPNASQATSSNEPAPDVHGGADEESAADDYGFLGQG